ncbi:MAG: hypothetical protein M1607_05040 [Patescibacteria group bacterium]|nr:hypothetical protein [Patescibacteria group bacterium]
MSAEFMPEGSSGPEIPTPTARARVIETHGRVHHYPEKTHRIRVDEAETIARISDELARIARGEKIKAGGETSSAVGEPPRRGDEGTMPPGMERLVVETQLGPRIIMVPSEAQDKINMLRSVLAKVEQTRTAGGGPGLQQEFERIGLMISGLYSPDYIARHSDKEDPNRDIGRKLYEEYIARFTFHQSFLEYETALDVKTIQTAFGRLNSEYLDTLFQLPGFIKALNLYEQHAEEYIQTGGTAKNAVRARIQYELADAFGGHHEKEDRKAWASDHATDYAWIQNLAERFWRLSGRMSSHDKAVYNEKKNKYEFTGDMSGGDWTMRRILKFNDFLLTQAESNRPIIRLMKGINLGAVDWLTDLAGSSEFGYDKKDHPDGLIKLRTLDNGSTELEFLHDGTAPKDASFWANKNFANIGNEPPAGLWAYRKLAQPDAARDAMYGKSDAFLRNPTPDSLYALIDTFSYLSEKQWETKRQLFVNFIEYAKSARKTETGKRLYGFTEIVAMANNLTGLSDEKRAPFINPSDRENALKKVLGFPGSISPDFYINTRRTLTGFIALILNLLKGIAQESIKLK